MYNVEGAVREGDSNNVKDDVGTMCIFGGATMGLQGQQEKRWLIGVPACVPVRKLTKYFKEDITINYIFTDPGLSDPTLRNITSVM